MTIIDGYERRAPAVPEETCPVIDRISNGIAMIDGWRAEMSSGQDDGLVVACDTTSKIIRAELEQVRRANAALRASGAYWHKAAREIAAMAERTEL